MLHGPVGIVLGFCFTRQESHEIAWPTRLFSGLRPNSSEGLGVPKAMCEMVDAFGEQTRVEETRNT